MKINILSIGTKMPGWVNSAFKEYQKRLNQEITLHLTELPADKNSKQTLDDKTWTAALAKIKSNSLVIALDKTGKQISTEQLADKLNNWMQNYSEINLLIGGSDGLPDICRQQAHFSWSFSKLTFPHMLARVITAEQLYRAWTILHNHPYHK